MPQQKKPQTPTSAEAPTSTTSQHPLGYKQKLLDAFFTRGKGKASRSAHRVVEATKHSHPEKLRFAKPQPASEQSAHKHELEASMADFYRFLLGTNRAPKTRAVPGFGVLSTEVPGFISFQDAMDRNNPLTNPNGLSERGFASLLAANYLLQENDAHWKNFGFNAEGKLARIDFDYSLAELTWGDGVHIVEEGPRTEYNFSKIDAYDLAHLTLPRSFKPRHTPLFEDYGCGYGKWGKGERSHIDSPLGQTMIAAETENPIFMFDKWKTLLKATLLSRDDIKNMFSAHYTDEEIIESQTDFLFTRFQKISATLQSVPEFQNFFAEHGNELYKAIKTEIEDYNNIEFKKHPDRRIEVNFENSIFKDIHEAEQPRSAQP